jgi:hypothetical protein
MDNKNVIDYRIIYERLKDKPASELTRELELFSRLYCWKLNDARKEESPNVERA